MKAKRKDTGEIVEIRAQDFDENVHEEIGTGAPSGDARTIGDMDPSEFSAGIASATSEAIASAFQAAGIGQVDRSGVVGSPPADEPRSRVPVSVRGPLERQLSRKASYRALSTEERAVYVDDIVHTHEWAVAVTNRDTERANRHAIETFHVDAETARQMSTGPGSGAALVPEPMQGPIVEKRNLADKVTPLSMQYRSGSTTLDLGAEATVLQMAGTAENASGNAVDPTYAPLVLTKKKATVIATSSRELVFDVEATMQFIENLSRQAGRAAGVYNNFQNMQGDGTGTNYTAGLLDGTNVPAVVGSGGAASRAKILSLKFAVPASYRVGAVWFADSDTLAILSALADSNGMPFYPRISQGSQTALTGDTDTTGAGTMEGHPVVEMDNTDMGGILLFGNPEFFATLVEDSLRVETTTSGGTAFENDQQKWKFVQRQDGLVSQSEAWAKTDTAVS